jgi:Phytanoyl-CoA dioxygenase (PhyH)
MSAPNTANPLPGVPLIDSPFFERVAAQANWSAETLRVARDLRDNGFSVLDFPDPEIDWLCDSLTAAFTPSPDKLNAWRLGKGEIRNQDAWRTNPNVKRVAINATIIRLLSTIYDRSAFAFQTLNFAVGTQQAAHSDAMHFSASPDGFMCGVWLALEDIDRDNGP